MDRRPDEHGVALLTVLLLVAVMSVLAVGVLDDIRFAVRRSTNAQTTGQAQWFALGAETLTKAQLGRLIDARPGRTTLEGGWDGKAQVYPIDGGAISARLSDRGSCFNLNSVVIGPAGEAIADADGVAEFAALLEAVGEAPDRALRLSNALADWIDANNDPSRFGAEDEVYARKRPAYRTAGALLVEESELRAVEGFTPEVYARVRPLVCALPQVGPTQLNVNTLSAQDAPVLSAVYRGRLPVEAARQVIARRPEAGWAGQSDFLAEPGLAGSVAAGGEPPLQQIVMSSRFFALDADVRYAGAAVAMSALLQAEPGGVVRTVARRWTRPE